MNNVRDNLSTNYPFSLMTKTVKTWQIGARQYAIFPTYQPELCVIAVETSYSVYRQVEDECIVNFGRNTRQWLLYMAVKV
jgi:hypothetical protein